MIETDVARLRAAFSKVTCSAAEATEAINTFGRELAKRNVAEMFKRYEARQRAARRRRRRADR